MSLTDNQVLIRSLNQSDKKAFIALVEKYQHPLFVYANSFVNNPMLAEDITQNVFIKVWEQRTKLNSEYSLKTYLYRSVYNEFINQYRKEKSVSKVESIYLETLQSIIEEEEQENTDAVIALVRSAIELLPEKCKRIFELSKQEGLTNIEISEYLGISIKTVEKQITKGYKIIRENVGEKIKLMLFTVLSIRKRNGKDWIPNQG
ncbi:RNA polymerase sigma factor [Robertkochia solimangrovi]|uniref:RNA polymerase sigma factor n=1 Tax=Robertkochia solimangrovi TaxID=2213046 RepID=UPI00117E38E8|nr:RNA polymerase sigma-70 factor [Robertkochia solimangrovi]TRZ41979.1 RNA polymerase sigma-70 factor [Robertkochia solimangrovi]